MKAASVLLLAGPAPSTSTSFEPPAPKRLLLAGWAIAPHRDVTTSLPVRLLAEACTWFREVWCPRQPHNLLRPVPSCARAEAHLPNGWWVVTPLGGEPLARQVHLAEARARCWVRLSAGPAAPWSSDHRARDLVRTLPPGSRAEARLTLGSLRTLSEVTRLFGSAVSPRRSVMKRADPGCRIDRAGLGCRPDLTLWAEALRSCLRGPALVRQRDPRRADRFPLPKQQGVSTGS
jgi:hypothetical protein